MSIRTSVDISFSIDESTSYEQMSRCVDDLVKARAIVDAFMSEKEEELSPAHDQQGLTPSTESIYERITWRTATRAAVPHEPHGSECSVVDLLDSKGNCIPKSAVIKVFRKYFDWDITTAQLFAESGSLRTVELNVVLVASLVQDLRELGVHFI
jgi:hypothetical protein